MFLNYFVNNDLCLSINQGGKIDGHRHLAKLGWVLWTLCKSLPLLSHKSLLTQVAVSHMGMCLSYLLYPIRDIYFSLLNSESPADSVGTQTVSQGNFGSGMRQWTMRQQAHLPAEHLAGRSIQCSTSWDWDWTSWCNHRFTQLLYCDLASVGYNLCHCRSHSSSTHLKQKDS